VRKFVLVAMALIAVVGAGVATSATSPFARLSDPVGNPDVPRCLANAPDTSAPFVCKVLPFLRPDWQAGLGEWIIVRTAYAVADQATCPALEAVVATYTLDGKALAVDQSACEFNSLDNVYRIDFRAVSSPLPLGNHAISTTFYFPLEGVLDDIPAGTTVTYNTTLSVAAGG